MSIYIVKDQVDISYKILRYKIYLKEKWLSLDHLLL